jgi:phage-related protein
MEFMSFVSLMVTMSFVSFFIYDGDAVVVLFNAFRKKTQKTPDSEIKKAIKLKEEYYGTKGNQ